MLTVVCTVSHFSCNFLFISNMNNNVHCGCFNILLFKETAKDDEFEYTKQSVTRGSLLKWHCLNFTLVKSSTLSMSYGHPLVLAKAGALPGIEVSHFVSVSSLALSIITKHFCQRPLGL